MSSELEPLTLDRKAKRLKNPWREPSGVRYQQPPSYELKRYRDAISGRDRYGHLRSPGSDPETVQLADFLFKRTEAREKQAAEDWDRQRSDYLAMHDELVRLFDEQSRLLVEQRQAVDLRVRWEFGGLLLAAVGTTLSGFAGL